MSSVQTEPPLCVDLDGTLIVGDTGWISLYLLATRKPWLVPKAPFVLRKGRAALKTFLASHVVPRPESLRWRGNVLAFLEAERAKGRHLVLTTAAHRRIADAVATHLGLFDDVLATEDDHNLKAEAKLAGIRKLTGDKGFDYIGDTFADLPILAAARQAYLVGPSARLVKRARRVANLVRVFPGT